MRLLHRYGGVSRAQLGRALAISAGVAALGPWGWLERLTGRWTCRAEGHVFHQKFNPPKEEGVCDYDGSELYQREDDKVETVTNRIKVYFKQTMPLIEYYQDAGTLIEVDGTKSIEDVSVELMSALSTMV